MAISSDTQTQLSDDILPALEEWKTQKLAEIDAQAEFLESVDVSISSLSESSSEDATDEGVSIIESLGVTVS